MPTLQDLEEAQGQPWAAVEFLIDELEHKGLHGRYAALVYQWDLVIRLFRHVERQRLFERTPLETDLKSHQTALIRLVMIGQASVFRIHQESDEQLAIFGITKENLLAYVQELDETWLAWHKGKLDPARQAEIEAKIFGHAEA